MKVSQIFDILDMTARAREQGLKFNPCFVSPPGLGKSEIVQQWAKSRGYQFVDVRAALHEAPDLIGYPEIVHSNEQQRVMKFATPDFWPRNGKAIILYDEINRGNTSVMNALMQGLTDYRIKDYVMPPGCIQAACINPETSTYDVNTMDPALKDRLEFFNVKYDKRTFLEWAKTASWDPTLLLFIETGLWTYKTPEDIGNAVGAKYLSPRSFSKLNSALKAGINDDHEMEYYCEMLGELMGKSFYQFKTKDYPVVFEDIVKDKRAALARLAELCHPKKYKTGHVSVLVRSMIENQKDVTLELLNDVVQVIGPEQGMGLVKEIEYSRANSEDLLTQLFDKYPKTASYLRQLKK